MKILIVGAGSTGGYFGALLTRAGRDVSFLVRSHRAEVLRANGLRIIIDGDTSVVRPRLLSADRVTEPSDLVLLSVKATALRSAMTDVAPAVGPQTMIVPFLNGIGHLDDLTTRFGAENVLGGVVKVATHLNQAGDIVRVAPFASLVIGALDGRVTSRIQAAHDALDRKVRGCIVNRRRDGPQHPPPRALDEPALARCAPSLRAKRRRASSSGRDACGSSGAAVDRRWGIRPPADSTVVRRRPGAVRQLGAAETTSGRGTNAS